MKLVSFNKDIKQIDNSGRIVGGVSSEGRSIIRLMMTGVLGQLVELNLKEGFYRPNHNHPKEESIGYVIKGHLKMGIGDYEYDLYAGDSWCHPDGIIHWTRAIEDTSAVEIHCPPRPLDHYYK